MYKMSPNSYFTIINYVCFYGIDSQDLVFHMNIVCFFCGPRLTDFHFCLYTGFVKKFLLFCHCRETSQCLIRAFCVAALNAKLLISLS